MTLTPCASKDSSLTSVPYGGRSNFSHNDSPQKQLPSPIPLQSSTPKQLMSPIAKSFRPPFEVIIKNTEGKTTTLRVRKCISENVYELPNGEILSLPPQNLIGEPPNKIIDKYASTKSCLKRDEALEMIEIIEYFIQQPKEELFLHGIHLWRVYEKNFSILNKDLSIQKVGRFLVFLAGDFNRAHQWILCLLESELTPNPFFGKVILEFISNLENCKKMIPGVHTFFYCELLKKNSEEIFQDADYIKMSLLSLSNIMWRLQQPDVNNFTFWFDELTHQHTISRNTLDCIDLSLQLILKTEEIRPNCFVDLHLYLIYLDKMLVTDIELWKKMIDVAAKTQDFDLIRHTKSVFVRCILTNDTIHIDQKDISSISAKLRQMLSKLTPKNLIAILDLNNLFMQTLMFSLDSIYHIFLKDLMYLFAQIMTCDHTYKSTPLLDHIFSLREQLETLPSDGIQEIDFLRRIDIPLLNLISLREDTFHFESILLRLKKLLDEIDDLRLQEELASIFFQFVTTHSKQKRNQRILINLIEDCQEKDLKLWFNHSMKYHEHRNKIDTIYTKKLINLLNFLEFHPILDVDIWIDLISTISKNSNEHLIELFGCAFSKRVIEHMINNSIDPDTEHKIIIALTKLPSKSLARSIQINSLYFGILISSGDELFNKCKLSLFKLFNKILENKNIEKSRDFIFNFLHFRNRELKSKDRTSNASSQLTVKNDLLLIEVALKNFDYQILCESFDLLIYYLSENKDRQIDTTLLDNALKFARSAFKKSYSHTEYRDILEILDQLHFSDKQGKYFFELIQILFTKKEPLFLIKISNLLIKNEKFLQSNLNNDQSKFLINLFQAFIDSHNNNLLLTVYNCIPLIHSHLIEKNKKDFMAQIICRIIPNQLETLRLKGSINDLAISIDFVLNNFKQISTNPVKVKDVLGQIFAATHQVSFGDLKKSLELYISIHEKIPAQVKNKFSLDTLILSELLSHFNLINDHEHHVWNVFHNIFINYLSSANYVDRSGFEILEALLFSGLTVHPFVKKYLEQISFEQLIKFKVVDVIFFKKFIDFVDCHNDYFDYLYKMLFSIVRASKSIDNLNLLIELIHYLIMNVIPTGKEDFVNYVSVLKNIMWDIVNIPKEFEFKLKYRKDLSQVAIFFKTRLLGHYSECYHTNVKSYSTEECVELADTTFIQDCKQVIASLLSQKSLIARMYALDISLVIQHHYFPNNYVKIEPLFDLIINTCSEFSLVDVTEENNCFGIHGMILRINSFIDFNKKRPKIEIKTIIPFTNRLLNLFIEKLRETETDISVWLSNYYLFLSYIEVLENNQLMVIDPTDPFKYQKSARNLLNTRKKFIDVNDEIKIINIIKKQVIKKLNGREITPDFYEIFNSIPHSYASGVKSDQSTSVASSSADAVND